MIQAALFDIGGVIIDEPKDRIFAYCALRLGVPLQEFTDAIKPYRIVFFRGEISEGDMWEKVCITLGVKVPNKSTSLWQEAFAHVYKKRLQMFALMKHLHQQGITVALLSNTEIPIMQYIIDHQWEGAAVGTFSCKEGVEKPHRQFFQRALEKIHIQPEKAIFIDDLPENVAGARAAGIEGIVFTGYPQLITALAQHGISVSS